LAALDAAVGFSQSLTHSSGAGGKAILREGVEGVEGVLEP
jgi:hypothetical protein